MEPAIGQVIDESAIRQLPSPVARSLRRSGVLGQPVPRRVRLNQRGDILLRNRWFPLTAAQTYTLDPPSFEWTARVAVAGLPVARAKDSLTDGRGRMHVRLFNLVSIIDATGPEMDQGALMRWLNETMWFPHVWATKLVSWRAVDDVTAVGKVTVGDLTVEAEFRFDREGHLVDFRADRYRVEGDDATLARWRTPVSDHGSFGHIEIPTRGHAVWELDTGDLEYIRLQITDIQYV